MSYLKIPVVAINGQTSIVLPKSKIVRVVSGNAAGANLTTVTTILEKLYISCCVMNQGLGDKIESFTKATGIKKMVDTVSQGLNIPCGCEHRKNMLNKMFPGK